MTIETAVNTAVAKKLIDDFCWEEYNENADLSDISHIPLAYTSLETDAGRYYEVNVYADLKKFRLVTEYSGLNVVQTESIAQYDSLEDLIEKELRFLDFDSLVSGIYDFEHREQACAVTESVKWVAVTVNSAGKTEIFHAWIDEGETWAVPAFREHAERMGGTVLALFRADDVVNVCGL